MLKDLDAVTTQLGAAYMTEHGHLLCHRCYELHRHQLGRAGIGMELVPCHGIVACTLCDRSATE